MGRISCRNFLIFSCNFFIVLALGQRDLIITLLMIFESFLTKRCFSLSVEMTRQLFKANSVNLIQANSKPTRNLCECVCVLFV